MAGDVEILVVNSGSSSIKFSLIDPVGEVHLFHGVVERIGEAGALLGFWDGEAKEERALEVSDHREAMAAVLALLAEYRESGWKPAAVGHRMVHGGEFFKESCLLDADHIEALRSCVPLAPLHNPVNLLGVEAAQAVFPDLLHVAVMDTAFHQSMPPKAYLYPVPYALYEEYGVRRYGFHGTSHRYVTEEAARLIGKPLSETAFVSAHLGNGCSAAAVLGGRSVDTTMGLTPLEGLVMGTRSGDVDPALHAFLVRNAGMDLDEVMDVLNTKSGLLGLSGLSNDMRTLVEAAEGGHERANLAVDIFCFRLAKSLAGLVVSLGRLDALIFTGGIGTYSSVVRERVLRLLSFLGLAVDEKKNGEHGGLSEGCISLGFSPSALVIKTDEEMVIARQTWGELKEMDVV